MTTPACRAKCWVSWLRYAHPRLRLSTPDTTIPGSSSSTPEVGLEGIRQIPGVALQITVQRVEPWQTVLIGQNDSPYPEQIGRGNGVLRAAGGSAGAASRLESWSRRFQPAQIERFVGRCEHDQVVPAVQPEVRQLANLPSRMCSA